MKNNKIVLPTVFSVSFIVLLSACATTKMPPAAVIEPDLPEPTLSVKEMPIKTKTPAERGSVASVLKKMQSNSFTLYWKEKNAYTFYVGGVLSAEYKPGDGLFVKENKAGDSGVTCQFGENEDVKPASACAQLMLTLDDELSE